MDINNDYFLTACPNIIENENLREPQITAYEKTYEHFIENKETSHAILVLPTGVGKTGLMGIIPYRISQGRVLIITPQLVIKDSVIGSLDSSYPGNFWLVRKVFNSHSMLPNVIEFDSSVADKPWFRESMDQSNIVILNIHKLQKRLKTSLLNNVSPNYFDMIIIDEAHHSTAKTWVDAVKFFSNAKVVKVTGTPYRTDKKEIAGKQVFKYKLSQAMAKNYVKSLEKFTYIPDKLYLTIDDNDDKKYTVEEIYNLNLKDEEWVSRTVAYSKECSEKVVNESVKKLVEKLEVSPKIPHKIIAVACSIKHAIQIKQLYEEKGYKSAIVHSKMSKEEISNNLKEVENHRVQVVINVAMLGEGYDHPYLSVAAIFRPFRHPLPYAQFIGRILRIIPLDQTNAPSDNIGQVVTHELLNLDELWDYYKNQIQESEVIRVLEPPTENDEMTTKKTNGERANDTTFGKAEEQGVGTVIRDAYLQTEMIKERNKKHEEQTAHMEQLQKMFGVDEKTAKSLLLQLESSNSELKRPDLYFKKKSQDIDNLIKYDIIPELIVHYKINKDGQELGQCRIFNDKRYNWIVKTKNNNAGFLAMYINKTLVDIIGYNKNKWTQNDLNIAIDKLDGIREFLESVLSEYTGIE